MSLVSHAVGLHQLHRRTAVSISPHSLAPSFAASDIVFYAGGLQQVHSHTAMSISLAVKLAGLPSNSLTQADFIKALQINIFQITLPCCAGLLWQNGTCYV